MKIGLFDLAEYVKIAGAFHGEETPELVIGGFMVETALAHLPEGGTYDVLCETTAGIPDAVQLLTPCTLGNGRLKIVDLGRCAVTVFEPHRGMGIRVYLNTEKLTAWPEIHTWYFDRGKGWEQGKKQLFAAIEAAAVSIFGVHPVRVKEDPAAKRFRGNIAVCPSCREGYPVADGPLCLACQGYSPYGE